MNAFFATSFVERLIKLLHCGDLVLGGAGTNGHIARHLAVTHHRYRIGAYPIVIAIFTSVFDNPAPGFALLQRVPHVGKSRFRHIRMAHNVVRLPEQLLERKAAHLHKGVVSVGHVAVEVGGRHKRGVIVQRIFILGDIVRRGHSEHPLQVI